MNPELPTVLLMAPTGVAAINIDGTTINAALAIPVQTGDNVPAMSDQKKTQMRLSLSELKLIIIDEISMVGNITLLHIHQRLKEIFGSSNSQMFAGISIIVVGDMYQLPPIRKKPVFANFKNDVFNLYHPWHLFTMIELVEIMRQKDDQPFAEMLNRFRTAKQTEQDIKCIQSRAIADPSENSYPSDSLHIWAENNPVNQHNEMKLENITGRLFHLKAIDQYPPNVSQQDIGRVLARPRSETGGLDSDIYIKETARVMLTTNIDIADRLINGQLGTIVRIEVNQNNQNTTVIYIKFDDVKAGSSLIQRSNHPFIRENQVVPLHPVLAKIKIRPNKPSSPEIERTQFPLTLAYAVSIHKVQGLSLTNVVISFDLVKQRTFNYDQVYVALSRATSLNGIHVLGTLENKHVKADPRVHEEYERLRNSGNCYLTIPTNENHHDDAILTICLLNIRSLRKHSIDIKYDSTIMNSDIIALTETQLLPHSNDSEIKNDLQPFSLYRQDHPTDRFCSLALCTKNTVQTCDQEYFPQVNATKFTIINNTTLLSYTILVLYRKNSSNISQYVQDLRNILNSHAIDMILGDININYLNDDTIQPVKSLMDSLEYSQIVQSPTFVSAGSTLDHVYVKPTFDIVQNSIVSVYYSDHDAVKISIKHK
ncbi:PREDICTED: ATP-dependent DNA helicase PIF1-like [Acropora digitifera]|uniref:ATP-dependent DNA helicase PIF1-like n=1 Tax=Acropora digitifera TaxID=70779 RepID=UPI00077A90F7|nr:PREDICTED: ATP-dependent DNA helicase PIF1-like [Acropora digitifera]